MNSKLSALLFDLDGTLLDSYPAHLHAFLEMFTHFGINVTEEKFLSVYTPNWHQIYAVLGLPREDWERANAVWLEVASQQETALFSGVRETLEELYLTYRLGIVTSGSRERILKDLDRTGIRPLFQTIITGDDVQEPKPSPQGLRMALQNLQVEPEQAIYVGDSQPDQVMARDAQVLFIGIPSRFGSLNPQGPCHLISTIPELVTWLQENRGHTCLAGMG